MSKHLHETVAQRLLQLMVRSFVTLAYICNTNDFPCTFLAQHKRVEPFVVRHILHHHLDCDLRCRVLEERISKQKIIENVFNKNHITQKIDFNSRGCTFVEVHLAYRIRPKTI